MTFDFIIHGELCDLNKYVNEQRRNRYGGNKTKQDQNAKVCSEILKCEYVHFDKPVYISYKWYAKDKRKDKDNIAFAVKFIQDALVNCKIIDNDGWKYIDGFSHEFYIDKENPRIEVYIRSVE